MRRKILVILVLLVLLTLFLTFAFGAPLKPVTKLTAKGEVGQVRLTWTKVSGAEGYIIYRQVGKGAFSYRYITPNGGFLDKTASTTVFNFYRVYPYKTVSGKKVVGPSNRYVYAKAVKPTYNGAVSGLKATPGLEYITVSWNKLAGANGYYVYRATKDDNPITPFKFMKATTGTSYDDLNPFWDWNFYRVYPYKIISGKQVAGKSTSYVYAREQYYEKKVQRASLLTPQDYPDGKILMRWDPVPGASGYQVEYDGTNEMRNMTANYYVQSNLDPYKIHGFSVTPYVIVKGRRVFGFATGWIYVCPYSTELAYYTGRYVVGRDIPSGKYEVYPDTAVSGLITSRYVSIIKASGDVVTTWIKGEGPAKMEFKQGEIVQLYGVFCLNEPPLYPHEW